MLVDPPETVREARRRRGKPPRDASGVGVLRSRDGSRERVEGLQRRRLLAATVWVVDEVGYGGMTVAGVLARSRVSRKTFYEMFESREECFLAVFDIVVGQIAECVEPAWKAQASWHDRVHGTLSVLLRFFDDEPLLARLCVVHALQAGPNVRERRAEILTKLVEAVGEGWESALPAHSSQCLGGRLMAEGVVGAVFMIVHERLLEPAPAPLGALAGPLTSIVLQAYRGDEALPAEPAGPDPAVTPSAVRARGLPPQDLFRHLDARLTNRTLEVLATIREHPGASNREIATGAGNVDQGQMSKLLARLARLELVRNTGAGQPAGAPNAWRLTAKGLAIESATRDDIELVGIGGQPKKAASNAPPT